MRRPTLVLAIVGLAVGVLAPPAGAQGTSTSPVDVSRGSVTLVVGPDSFGEPTWTATFSGTFAVGGQTFAGTAIGSGEGGHNAELDITSFQGTSSTGSLTGECNGTFVDELRPVPTHDYSGVIHFTCLFSINGAPGALTELVVGLLPTTDAQTFNGVYAGTPVPPDLTHLPAVPVVSAGRADAVVTGPFNPFQSGPGLGFGYGGQITLRGRTFQGEAGGGTTVPALSTVMHVPPFSLAGQNATDTLNATCSGTWLGTNRSQLAGAALSLLTCNGSINGGPPGQVTLLAVYRLTFPDDHNDQYSYSGVFAGI